MYVPNIELLNPVLNSYYFRITINFIAYFNVFKLYFDKLVTKLLRF